MSRAILVVAMALVAVANAAGVLAYAAVSVTVVYALAGGFGR